MKSYYFNRISFNYGLPLFVFSFLIIVFAYLYLTLKSEVLLYCILGLILFVGTILLFGFARKVNLHESKIEFVGIKNQFNMEFSEVMSFGVIEISSLGHRLIPEDRINKYSILGTKFIFLCKNEIPNFGNKISEDYIIFQYRSSAYEYIKNKISAS